MGRIKKAKKAPEFPALPVDAIEPVAFPHPRVPNPANIDPQRLGAGQTVALAGIMESALAEPRNPDEEIFVREQRKMLENVFGPINWDK